MKRILILMVLLSSFIFGAKIEVVGNGTVKVSPNIIKINLGIQTQKENLQEALSENQKSISALYETLNTMGIDKKDMTTSQFYLSYYKDEDKKDTYVISNNLEIKIRDMAKIDEVISTSTSMGVNNIWGLNFTAEEDSNLASEARKLALKDAKDKATEYANATGLKLGKIVEIVEIQTGNYNFETSMKATSFSKTSVYGPDQIDYNSSVKVIYELK